MGLWRERAVAPRARRSEVGLVLLEFHHEVMDVDELSPGRRLPQRAETAPGGSDDRADQLGQSSLSRESHEG